MAIFLDSARIDEVRRARDLGYVLGVTTNPSLMARVDARPRDVIGEICGLVRGPVFYQLTGPSIEEREAEAREFHAICPDKVVLKIAATSENMTLIARLSPDVPCAATAVFGGHQGYVAGAAGARYLIPYVNRATKLIGDGFRLVEELVAVARASGAGVQVLAASIKSPEEAAATVLAGAHHLTMGLDVITALGNHHLSDAAIAAFEADLKR